MKKFVFNLEPLYDYRKRLEELGRKELKEALKRLEDEETRLELIKEMNIKASSEIDRMKEEGAPMEEFNLYYAYLKRLKEHIAEQDRIIAEVRANVETKRDELAEAAKKKKVVELLKEKTLELHREMEGKVEQKTSDDLTTSRFRHKEMR